MSAVGERELLRLAGEIRGFAPDLVVYLMSLRGRRAVRRDEWFFRLACGVRRIVGLPTPNDRVRVYDPVSGMYQA